MQSPVKMLQSLFDFLVLLVVKRTTKKLFSKFTAQRFFKVKEKNEYDISLGFRRRAYRVYLDYTGRDR